MSEKSIITVAKSSSESGAVEWDYKIVGEDTFDSKNHRATVSGSFVDYEAAVTWVKNALAVKPQSKNVTPTKAEVTS